MHCRLQHSQQMSNGRKQAVSKSLLTKTEMKHQPSTTFQGLQRRSEEELVKYSTRYPATLVINVCSKCKQPL